MVTANYNEKGEHFLLNKIETGTLMDFTYKGAKMKGALEEAVDYVKQRKQFGTSISSFQGIQFMLADMAILLR